MNYKFNNDYVLRFKFFGGLLHSILSATEFELSLEYAVFLKCLQMNYIFCDAVDFVSKFFNINFTPEISLLLEEKIICVAEKTSKALDYDFLKGKMNNEINKVKNTSHLSFPIQASLYLNSSCQLNCKFCFFEEKKQIYNRKMNSSEKWINLIRKLKRNGIIYLSILGGEPTLYPNINEILKYINKEKIKTTITTNALLIKDETMKIIIDSDYITPTISLESLNDETNYYLMGTTTEKQLKVINYLLKNNKVPRINSVYTNQTDEEIFDIIDFCIDAGVKDYFLSYYINTNDKVILKKHSFSDMKKLNERINQYIMEKQYSDRINFQIQGCMLFSAYEEDDDIKVETQYEQLKYGCEAGNTKIEIMPDGTVLPCVLFKEELLNYDNAFEKDIKDIWDNSESLNLLRKTKCENSRCRDCKFSNFCNGGCPALKLINKKSLIDDYDDRCEMKEKGYERI